MCMCVVVCVHLQYAFVSLCVYDVCGCMCMCVYE